MRPTFNMKCQYNYFVCMNHYFRRLLISSLHVTHAHPKFVYKLDMNNHKTVSNEKDMKNF